VSKSVAKWCNAKAAQRRDHRTPSARYSDYERTRDTRRLVAATLVDGLCVSFWVNNVDALMSWFRVGVRRSAFRPRIQYRGHWTGDEVGPYAICPACALETKMLPYGFRHHSRYLRKGWESISDESESWCQSKGRRINIWAFQLVT